jgi:DNA-binding transcriptional ArsR family regulator
LNVKIIFIIPRTGRPPGISAAAAWIDFLLTSLRAIQYINECLYIEIAIHHPGSKTMGKVLLKKSPPATDRIGLSAAPAAGVQNRRPPPIQTEALRSVAFLSKTLADENRLRILQCIYAGRKSVTEIVEELGISQPLASHHLKELKRCLLLTVERSGAFIYYAISDPRILDIIRHLDALAADLLAARKSF